jgi:hypothetical protein
LASTHLIRACYSIPFSQHCPRTVIGKKFRDLRHVIAGRPSIFA